MSQNRRQCGPGADSSTILVVVKGRIQSPSFNPDTMKGKMSDMKNTSKEQKGERMDEKHLFKFKCYPGVPCFTQCCRDVTIVLTPYDVLRLKKALGISSDKFLDDYTVIIPKEKRLIPMVALKMNEKDKNCPFVSEEGCAVYQDRPWPCRMYPLDMEDDGTFRIIATSSHCLGLKEEKESSIREWLVDQGIVPYEEMNALLSTVTTPLQAQDLDIENPDIEKMVFMALYNLDRFRDFIFKSTFLKRLDVPEERVSGIEKSDEELLKLGIDWVKFGLLGEKLFYVKNQSS
ncbi:MAG: YkgJ family cysteine cluster protein [Deltaproteobacteria bacterium]|nr:YkgJ family cysteine cluster protein [Deltaproteobacteria bacterium]